VDRLGPRGPAGAVLPDGSIRVTVSDRLLCLLCGQDPTDTHVLSLAGDTLDSVGLPVFEVFSPSPRQVISNIMYTFGRIIVSTGLINFERMPVRSVKVQVRGYWPPSHLLTPSPYHPTPAPHGNCSWWDWVLLTWCPMACACVPWAWSFPLAGHR
jgi:hypothetical protein